jgi:hypothetical protein
MLMTDPFQHKSLYQKPTIKIVGDKAIRYSDIMVHEFNVSDVEDLEIYIADPLYHWTQSEAGQWVISHALEKPYWITWPDPNTFYTKVVVMARLSDADQIYFKLKFQ